MNRITLYDTIVRNGSSHNLGQEHEKYLEYQNEEKEVIYIPILLTQKGMQMCDFKDGTKISMVYGNLVPTFKEEEKKDNVSIYGIKVYAFLTKKEEDYLEYLD